MVHKNSSYRWINSSLFALEENGEDRANSQPSMDHMPSNLDICADTMGTKEGRIFGLGSVGKTLTTSSSQPAGFSTIQEMLCFKESDPDIK
ncbi:golgin subfamily A member 5 [Spatholobus suberectus]|nr:golgin subfamily A member 5 [Spatholobus suberectus]